MHMTKVPGLLLVLLCCEQCLTIKVPITWDESANSEVKNDSNEEIPVEIIQAQNVQNIKPQNVQVTRPNQQPIPIEYFQYTAQKPKYAADIAAFHGAKNPQKHFKTYPVRPYTGKQKPALGIHHMLDDNKTIFQPFQTYVQQNTELNRYVKPTSTDYEIFHPYKAEEPGLQEIYKDPVLTKIRNDLQDSKNRLQAYEQQAGEPNIAKDEYLESPETTDGKLFPQKNVPTRYEIHRPERRPIYYRTPLRDSHRDHVLNQKFRHPWNQQNVKIRPVHYRPLHHHIHNLRQQHAIKYDDERNEYPQITASENLAEPQDGYDIYEKGKQKYTQLRNNLDESVNQIVQKNRPATYQKLELQKNDTKDDEVEDEFVPVKNYAQVRKIETFKHVPKKSAFEDAETYEEILNAPRLREAVKSTKAQTVYSEEGYEDSAYDHAGEQKHASDHEGHGGFLKEHENSGGLYKIPTVSGKYQDGQGSEYRDNTEHGEKWKNNNKDDEEETEAEDYFEVENEQSVDADIHKNDGSDSVNRNKREGDIHTDNNSDNYSDGNSSSDIDSESNSQNNQDDNDTNSHEVGKREVNFKVPEINLSSTFSINNETSILAKQKVEPKKDNIKVKYPYYFKNVKGILKNSPLRYSENLKLIPKKSNGGTEFYDSRSKFECPEVDEKVDPLPEKLKNGENPTEEDEDGDESKTKGQKSFNTIKKQPRLKGLGDKIDCFKAKYFGENPLDSPFFNEEIISNPEPIVALKLPSFRLKNAKKENAQESKINNFIDSSGQLKEAGNTNIFVLLDKLRSDQSNLQDSLNKTNEQLKTFLYTPQTTLAINDTQQSNMYTDILNNLRNNINPQGHIKILGSLLNPDKDDSNVTYNFFQNKEEVTKTPLTIRKKRATPFVYEPYKIIRDSQVQDSKKTTTTSNISPLIKQLQSSRVADRVSRSNKEDKQVKPSNGRTYVDIGRNDRSKPHKSENDNSDATFVDVSVDHRRGEPRYELRPINHKSQYTPVENKRAMSVEAYKTHTTTDKNQVKQQYARGRQRFRSTTTTVRPYYDLSQFIPKSDDVQNVAASTSIKKTITTAAPQSKNEEQKKHDDGSGEENSNEDYDDEEEEEEEEDNDDDDEEEEEEFSTTTITTTLKPSFRRRIRVTTTTEKIPEHTTEAQLLKLVTRFRNYKPDENSETRVEVTEPPEMNKSDEEDDVLIPKYREKKKKSHKSTLVTDTKKYGDDDEDDMREEEVDAMIGIKHDMDDYKPMYEKEEKDKEKRHPSRNEEENDNHDDEEEEEEEDGDDDDDDDNGADDDEHEEEEKPELEPAVTTPEPTKRTLIRTTDAPPTTVATHVRSTFYSRTVKPGNKPIVTRKKIEIHKELPVNKSSPHLTQFKQDIKEVEIIKEIPVSPKRKPHKNAEVLDLYKDDNLAKEINKLGDVEIFRENLNVDKGPKHGGNYRQATNEDLRRLKSWEDSTKPPKDAETSQSENKKHVELDDYEPKRLHGGNLKSSRDMKRARNNGRSSKLIELSDPPIREIHGGNLKYDNKRRGGSKSEKLIELDDDNDEDEDHPSRHEDGYKSNHSRDNRMHGGNYKNAKLVAPQENDDDIHVKSTTKNTRRSAAVLLNSFVQAVPILTSTPGYILDPSKRMYYYVDA